MSARSAQGRHIAPAQSARRSHFSITVCIGSLFRGLEDSGIEPAEEPSPAPDQPLPMARGDRYDGVVQSKIVTREQLAAHLGPLREAGKRVVFTNGCFDLLHIGHTRYLQAAKSLGDLLVVGVNTDASVRSLEKAPDRPIVPETQRAEVLAALGCVDFVVLFAEPDPERLITALQPDILVKGGDWAPDKIVGRDAVEARGGVVRTIPLVPGLSTTALLERIRSTAK